MTRGHVLVQLGLLGLTPELRKEPKRTAPRPEAQVQLQNPRAHLQGEEIPLQEEFKINFLSSLQALRKEEDGM